MPTATARVVDEEEPLIRNNRSRRNPTAQTKEGFYFGCPSVPEENKYEYFTILCTLILCLVFFVMVPILALVISGDRACDTSRLQGVTAPYKGELIPEMPVMVEYYTDWYQYSKLFDVYDGATSSATSADRAGYYYYVNILSFLRFGYADEDERVWFEGRYYGFGARLKPYADMEATRCEGNATNYRVTEDYWDRTWFCWSRCRRTFHVYTRPDETTEFKAYADAVFYDEPRYDYGFDESRRSTSLKARSMNLTDAKSGALLSQAHLILGDPYAEIGLAALNRWVLDFGASDKGLWAPPPHWLVSFVVAMDDVPNRSVAWLFAFLVFLTVLGMMWLQNQQRDRMGMSAVERLERDRMRSRRWE